MMSDQDDTSQAEPAEDIRTAYEVERDAKFKRSEPKVIGFDTNPERLDPDLVTLDVESLSGYVSRALKEYGKRVELLPDRSGDVEVAEFSEDPTPNTYLALFLTGERWKGFSNDLLCFYDVAFDGDDVMLNVALLYDHKDIHRPISTELIRDAFRGERLETWDRVPDGEEFGILPYCGENLMIQEREGRLSALVMADNGYPRPLGEELGLQSPVFRFGLQEWGLAQKVIKRYVESLGYQAGLDGPL